MKKINYKSDFDFILRLRSCSGEEIGWPEYNWTARFWTSQKVNAFVVSCTDGVCENCYNDNGLIHVVMNNHRLSAGVLKIEFVSELPNGIYPDESERVVVPLPLDIELIRAAAPCPENFEVELLMPLVKGEKGDKGDKGDKMTFQDLTAEDLEELQHGVAAELATSTGVFNFVTTGRLDEGHTDYNDDEHKPERDLAGLMYDAVAGGRALSGIVMIHMREFDTDMEYRLYNYTLQGSGDDIENPGVLVMMCLRVEPTETLVRVDMARVTYMALRDMETGRWDVYSLDVNTRRIDIPMTENVTIELPDVIPGEDLEGILT